MVSHTRTQPPAVTATPIRNRPRGARRRASPPITSRPSAIPPTTAETAPLAVPGLIPVRVVSRSGVQVIMQNSMATAQTTPRAANQ